MKKFDLKGFVELDLKSLLIVNGGTNCGSSYSSSGYSSSGSNSGGGGQGSSVTTDYKNPAVNLAFKSNYGGLHHSGTYGAGVCSSITSSTENNPSQENSNAGTYNQSVNGGSTPGTLAEYPEKEVQLIRTQTVYTNDNDESLAKIANGLAYPLGIEYDTKYVVTDLFGPREPIKTENGWTSNFHNGIDIAAAEGTRINSIADGTVIEVGSNNSLGNYVIVEHPNGTHTRYAHCSEITATEGSYVSGGQQIGKVGSTGMSTGAHLHFSFDGNGDGEYNDYKYDDPERVLKY